MNKKMIKVLFIAPGEFPVVKEIDDSYETLRSLVGGYIEIPHFFDDVDIVIDEEGKLKGLPANKGLCYDGETLDILVGNIVITKYDDEGESVSLSDELIKKYTWFFGSRDYIDIDDVIHYDD